MPGNPGPRHLVASRIINFDRLSEKYSLTIGGDMGRDES
jgi:hypothetical protein